MGMILPEIYDTFFLIPCPHTHGDDPSYRGGWCYVVDLVPTRMGMIPYQHAI